MDVTHIPQFGKNCYVYVIMDTYSRFTFATACVKENTQYVIFHCLAAFAALGCPLQIKTIMLQLILVFLFSSFAANFKLITIQVFLIIFKVKPL